MSFTRAAEELYLTQSAVSHRVKKLETRLQFTLFLRFNRQIELTKEGQQLLEVLDGNLQSLETVIRDLRRQDVTGRLTLSSAPSFTLRWLTPRLSEFQNKYPGLLLNIETRDRQIDFRHDAVDVAVYYGDGNYPGLHVVKLLDEVHVPVCSSGYAKEKKLFDKPERLKECLLLHDSSTCGKEDDYAEWRYWYQSVGIPEHDLSYSYCFNQTELAVAAAMNGQGVALGKYRLLAQEFARGRLVVPFDLPVAMGHSYYVVCCLDRVKHPSVQALVGWLQQQAVLEQAEL